MNSYCKYYYKSVKTFGIAWKQMFMFLKEKHIFSSNYFYEITIMRSAILIVFVTDSFYYTLGDDAILMI